MCFSVDYFLSASVQYPVHINTKMVLFMKGGTIPGFVANNAAALAALPTSFRSIAVSMLCPQ